MALSFLFFGKTTLHGKVAKFFCNRTTSLANVKGCLTLR